MTPEKPQTTTVRVRIAPSPTGFLHVGTARTALFNWLFARHCGGRFILRIEDTDVERSSEEMVEVIREGLAWLGLDWDEGPYFQSERTDIYQEYARRLVSEGALYRCYCTPQELAAKKEKAMRERQDWKYDRTCRGCSTEELQRRDAEGQQYALRFYVPPGVTTYEDGVHGRMEVSNREIEDFVVVRSDGMPTYNFACVVDDHDMGITHVMRGADHLSNTFKQILLYQALEIEPPQFVHFPLLLGTDRAKISKRHGAVSMTEYRAMGFLPQAIVNFLALLCWNPGDEREIMALEEIVAAFTLDRVNRSAAIFDLQKLEWMNGQYINAMPDEELVDAVIPFWRDEGLIDDATAKERRDWLAKIVALLKERARRLTDFPDLARYFFVEDVEYDPDGVEKHFREEGVIERLERTREALCSLSEFSAEASETAVRSLAEEMGIKAAKLIHPIRLAVTGMLTGPGLFELLELVGQEKTLRRLTRAEKFATSALGGDAPGRS